MLTCNVRCLGASRNHACVLPTAALISKWPRCSAWQASRSRHEFACTPAPRQAAQRLVQCQSLMDADAWNQKARKRTHEDIIAAGRRAKIATEVVEQGLADFEALLPGVIPSLEALSATNWAKVVSDSRALAQKVLVLKEAFPRLDLQHLVMRWPKVLMWSVDELTRNVEVVRGLLGSAPRPEAILYVLPEMLEPKQAVSVVVTLRKWFPKRDPIEKLQEDPEVIRRAEACDVPLEPVFYDAANASWSAASYSREKRQPWQEYIDKHVYKRKDAAEGATTADGSNHETTSTSGVPVPASPLAQKFMSMVVENKERADAAAAAAAAEEEAAAAAGTGTGSFSAPVL